MAYIALVVALIYIIGRLQQLIYTLKIAIIGGRMVTNLKALVDIPASMAAEYHQHSQRA